MTRRNARKCTETHAAAHCAAWHGGTLHARPTAGRPKRRLHTRHRWRGTDFISPPLPLAGEGRGEGEYTDEPGFCYSATLAEVEKNGYVLTPGRYVGAPEEDDNDEAFEDKMQRLTAQLGEQMAKGAELDTVIKAKLGELGYEV